MKILGTIKNTPQGEDIFFNIQIPDLFYSIEKKFKTKEQACEAILHDLGELFKDHTNGRVTLKNLTLVIHSHKIEIFCTDTKAVVSLMLKRLRGKSAMTLLEVCEKTGQKSTYAIWQYETGRVEPTLWKIQELANAMGYDIHLSLIKLAS